MPSHASADPPLKWIGMIALGSFIGFAITATAFLSLADSETTAPAAQPSIVTMVTAGQALASDTTTSEHAPREIAAEAQLLLSRRASSAEAHAPDAARAEEGAPEESVGEESPGEEGVAEEPGVQYASGPPPAEGEHTHIVGEGETLWSIAAGYSVSPRELALRNNLAPEAQIAAGDTLVIPAAP